ncbi:MAG: hypothetical protein JKY96_05315 [Phycisphaerales bacterium]|nr:hypothetical protein [Phycisphaerales bacterium]
MSRRSAIKTTIRVCAVSLACLGTAVVISGCQRTALRPADSRSQFDQYDHARNQRAEPFTEDEFGKRTPNLRGRLIVHD